MLAKMKKTRWLLNPCPRCNGNLFIEETEYGTEAICINCGYSKDITPQKISKLPQVNSLELK